MQISIFRLLKLHSFVSVVDSLEDREDSGLQIGVLLRQVLIGGLETGEARHNVDQKYHRENCATEDGQEEVLFHCRE